MGHVSWGVPVMMQTCATCTVIADSDAHTANFVSQRKGGGVGERVREWAELLTSERLPQKR